MRNYLVRLLMLLAVSLVWVTPASWSGESGQGTPEERAFKDKHADQYLENVKGERGVKPKGGFVSDAKTATAIAEAVLVPVYGEQVLDQRPFHAIAKKEFWHVYGDPKTGVLGGVAHVKIRKSDGTILFMIHSQ